MSNESWLILVLAGTYVLVAYTLVPWLWKRYCRHHPALASTPNVTVTSDGHPGDPLNVALVGDVGELQAIMKSAGWFTVDALGLRSDLRIAADTVLRHPYDHAPVSNLYLFGRKEDLAFEKPVGNDPRHRHHVRFWKAANDDESGRPCWVGAVTYDERVGLSYTTGQITHHIDGNVDAERDHLASDLQATGQLLSVRMADNLHSVRSGTNGGGDRWFTDGRLFIGWIRPASPDSPMGTALPSQPQ